MDYSILDQYSFLKIIEQKHKEEVEVTTEAVKCYNEKYHIYNKENGWYCHEYSSKRNQMSTSGAWLYRKDRKTINMAGDILTSISAFSGCKEYAPVDLYELFNRLYHTKGNCIPWPEGGNLGGRPWKDGGSPDVFSRKLIECKKIFEEKCTYDTDCVQCRIKHDRYLGRGISKFSCIYYWIKNEWKNKSWEDFVNENYLQDMVDSELNPISFVVGNDNTDYHLQCQDEDCVRETLLQSIKMIIRRGYRIENNGTIDETIINEIYKGLQL